MQSSWENELIALQKTDDRSFDIFAKDIQKTTGRLSFSDDENAQLYFEIEEPYRHHHYASNAVYVFDQYAHEAYQIPVFTALFEKTNTDAQHVLEQNGYERINEDDKCWAYAHHKALTSRDDSYHPDGKKVLYLAGGCFWGMEKVFHQLDGVIDTTVGYANGHTDNPTYEEVCRNETGYKETVRVTYDPSLTSTETLIEAYFLCIDPTKRNRQGNDFGTQYQTGIYYRDPHLLPAIRKVYEAEKQKYQRFFVELEELTSFYEAEEYHQDYLTKHPQGYCHITSTELDKVRALNASKRLENHKQKNY